MILCGYFLYNFAVAPLVGAGIEISDGLYCVIHESVAPLVGAGIEMPL